MWRRWRRVSTGTSSAALVARPRAGGETISRNWLGWSLALAVIVVSVIVSWPLAAQLGSSLPGDYGDPVFVMWVMAWVNDHVTRGAFDVITPEGWTDQRSGSP